MDFEWMIDFVQATKHLSDKDRPFFGDCKLEGRFASGWEMYGLQGCERVEIRYNPALGWLVLKGSIMYYWQGHNFTYSRQNFVGAINHIGRLLHVSLWDAIVNIFEYGVIMQVERKPKEYIQRHSAKPSGGLIQNEKGNDNGNFRWWEGKGVALKMYDAGRNIKMKQGYQRQTILKEAGWQPDEHLLKWEAQYLKPEVLNQGQGLRLSDLANPQWEKVFKTDLYNQYKRIVPMKSLVTPTSKKDLSTADILMQMLAEQQINAGKNLQEVKKMIYDRINACAELSKDDKGSRKKQIRALFDKLQEAPESAWDLSEKLSEVLDAK